MSGASVSLIVTAAESLAERLPGSSTVRSTWHASGLLSDDVLTLRFGVADVASLKLAPGHVLVHA